MIVVWVEEETEDFVIGCDLTLNGVRYAKYSKTEFNFVKPGEKVQFN